MLNSHWIYVSQESGHHIRRDCDFPEDAGEAPTQSGGVPQVHGGPVSRRCERCDRNGQVPIRCGGCARNYRESVRNGCRALTRRNGQRGS